MKFLLFLLLIFAAFTGFTQLPDTLSIAELEGDGYAISNSISGFPCHKLPENSNKIFLATKESEQGYIVLLLAAYNDFSMIRIASTRIDDEAIYNCQSPYVFCEGEYLKLECQWMRGLTFGKKLKFQNNNLTYIESYHFDLNEWVYNKADSALKNNDPVSYCEAYLSAQYYSDLNFRIIESLEWAYKNSLQLYKNKEFQRAALLMMNLEKRCDLVTNYELFKDSNVDFLKIWSDVTLFYLKAGYNEPCIELSKKLLDYDPELTGVLLQYGDALFNINRNGEAQEIYEQYISKMTRKDLQDKIPTRVFERIEKG